MEDIKKSDSDKKTDMEDELMNIFER